MFDITSNDSSQLSSIYKMTQQDTTYNVTSRWDVQHIPVKEILISKPIATAVTASGGSISGMGFKADPKPAPAPLNRMENYFYETPSMVEAMKSGAKFPPIEVYVSKTVGDTTYYTIIQGRHRFASSIVVGYSHVPAKVINNDSI